MMQNQTLNIVLNANHSPASANSERLSETKIKRITLITVHRSIVRQSRIDRLIFSGALSLEFKEKEKFLSGAVFKIDKLAAE